MSVLMHRTVSDEPAWAEELHKGSNLTSPLIVDLHVWHLFQFDMVYDPAFIF